MIFTPEDGSEPTKYEVYQFKVGGEHLLRVVSRMLCNMMVL